MCVSVSCLFQGCQVLWLACQWEQTEIDIHWDASATELERGNLETGSLSLSTFINDKIKATCLLAPRLCVGM